MIPKLRLDLKHEKPKNWDEVMENYSYINDQYQQFSHRPDVIEQRTKNQIVYLNHCIQDFENEKKKLEESLRAGKGGK